MINNFDINDTNLANKLNVFIKNINLSCDDIFNEYKTDPYINYLLYILNNEIVGFVSFDIIYDRIEIINIFVDKLFRKQKIGYKLLNKVIEEGIKLNVKNITLEVDETNNPAISLYEKVGFRIVSTRKNYYKNNNGYLMEKEMI